MQAASIITLAKGAHPLNIRCPGVPSPKALGTQLPQPEACIGYELTLTARTYLCGHLDGGGTLKSPIQHLKSGSLSKELLEPHIGHIPSVELIWRKKPRSE